MNTASRQAVPPLRVVHLNSMLKGGGTDDQCVKLVQGLRGLGVAAWGHGGSALHRMQHVGD